MNTRVSKSAPSSVDIKRLYAESGNRCAFPKCTVNIAQETTIIGEICHINASNPGGPRYDSQQTQAQRHGYENLILLCANHHKVIDDDEESYSVVRLQKMKAEHAKTSISIPKSEHVEQIAKVLIDQSIASQNQTGGIAAHTVNATNLHVHSSPSNTIKSAREIQAIEFIWGTIVEFKTEFSGLILVHDIMTSAEIAKHISGEISSEFISRMVGEYQDIATLLKKLNGEKYKSAAKEQPFIDQLTFSNFNSIYTIYSRLASLMYYSFVTRTYMDWRVDVHTASILGGMFSGELGCKLIKPQPQTNGSEFCEGEVG